MQTWNLLLAKSHQLFACTHFMNSVQKDAVQQETHATHSPVEDTQINTRLEKHTMHFQKWDNVSTQLHGHYTYTVCVCVCVCVVHSLVFQYAYYTDFNQLLGRFL